MSRGKQMRGVTLIEIMVALALVSVIIAAALGAFVSTNNASNQTYFNANLQENARLSLDALAYDLRGAGLGASNGTIGIAPGGTWTMRVPTIYTGPSQNFTDPNGNNFALRSVYILGAEPATVGPNGAGDGIGGVITDPLLAKAACNTSGNTGVNCAAAAIGADGLDHGLLVSTGANTYQPLLLHDHQRAAIISPTAITPFVAGTAQTISYAESVGPITPSPDPNAPFGFAQGFQIARLRVVHWYLKQAAGELPRLYRSRPKLAPSTGTCANPFIDETNDPTNGIAGVEMGAGPVESLQLRFLFDNADQDNPNVYAMTDTIDPCTTSSVTMRQMREVRIQLVSISPSTLKDTNGNLIARFKTPAFEGTAASPTADAFPRRAYVARVAPRNFVPYRL